MTGYARIVVAIDRSGSPEALSYAAAEAVRLRATLELLHVLDPHGTAGGSADTDLFDHESADRLAHSAETARGQVLGQVSVTARTAHGPITETILGASRGACLVVVGRHLGSRNDVAARCNVPVVVVPEGWRP